jgi:hypothetical protein
MDADAVCPMNESHAEWSRLSLRRVENCRAVRAGGMCGKIRLRFLSVRLAPVNELRARLWMKNCGAREFFEDENRESPDQRRQWIPIRILLPHQKLVRQKL